MYSQLIMTVKGLAVIFAAIHAFAWLLRREDAEWVKGAPRTIFVGMFLIGMWGYTVWVAYLAMMLFVPILARNRADAAAFYAVAILSVPALGTKMALGSFYLFPASKWLFCGLGLTIAFFIRNSGPRTSIARRFDIPVLIVFVLEAGMARTSSFTDTARQLLPLLLSVMVPYFVISRSLNTKQDVRRFLLALALGGFVMASVAVVESRLHWLLYKTIENNMHIDARLNPYTKLRGGMIRAPASFPESTNLANYLALAGVALFALRASFSSTRRWYLALGVIALGLLAANSRGGFVGIAIGMVAFDLYRRHYSALAAKIATIGLCYTLFLAAAQVSAYFASVVGKSDATIGSSDYRVLLLRRGMEEIRKHPYFGTTRDQAIASLQDIKQGEGIVDLVNGYIAYGLTLGYPGMIGLLMIFVSLCLAMLLARRGLSRDRELAETAAFVFAVSSLVAVSSFFTGFGGENSMPFCEVAALGSVMWALRKGRASVPESVHSATNSAFGSPVYRRIAADRAAAKERGSPAAISYRMRTAGAGEADRA
ncbi:MAG TPA: O-antigen ligase family protein [Sphingomonas sp.]|nr:O-antigen ligase family protein [Sphingomonas sp.]